MIADRGPGAEPDNVPFLVPPPVIASHANMEPEFHPYGMDRMPHSHVILEAWDWKRKNRAADHIDRYHRFR